MPLCSVGYHDDYLFLRIEISNHDVFDSSDDSKSDFIVTIFHTAIPPTGLFAADWPHRCEATNIIIIIDHIERSVNTNSINYN